MITSHINVQTNKDAGNVEMTIEHQIVPHLMMKSNAQTVKVTIAQQTKTAQKEENTSKESLNLDNKIHLKEDMKDHQEQEPPPALKELTA